MLAVVAPVVVVVDASDEISEGTGEAVIFTSSVKGVAVVILALSVIVVDAIVIAVVVVVVAVGVASVVKELTWMVDSVVA